MSKPSKLVLVTCLWFFFQTFPVYACRFNVREVGCVDLGIQPYYLCGYVSQDTPADIVSSFKEISYAALMGSNIEIEMIDVDKQEDHPAMKYLAPARDPALRESKAGAFPAAVLVSPDGQSLLVPIVEPDRPFKETLSSALDSILCSPKRKEILEQVSKTYGVVLLIEGTDAQENEKASQAASAAIEQISSQMEWLPKPIAHPPVLVVVEQQSLSQEKILLWSLGLDAKEITRPHAVVLYGRARWLGPMFVGEQITEDNLAAILFVIGADCECGLDQRWLQGTMLPAKWDEKLLELAAETLEFDPENPMVKMEISWIVRRGYYSYPGVPSGYHESVADDEPVPETQPDPRLRGDMLAPAEAGVASDPVRGSALAAVQAPNATSPSAVDLVSEPRLFATGGAKEDSPLKKPLYLIAGLTVLVIAGGLLIVVRQARKNL